MTPTLQARKRTLSRAAGAAMSFLFLCPVLAQDFSSNLRQPAPPPQSPQRQQADAALQSHDFSLALKLLTPLSEANPKDAHLLYDLGSAQDALDQNSAAEQTYRAAIADDPKFVDPHVALGLLLARAARFEDAHAELLAATTLPAGDPALKARAFRALARIDQKPHPAAARDELLEALKLSPETAEDTLLAAELALSAADGTAVAEAAYRRVLALQPEDPPATAGLAKLLAQTHRLPEAEALLTQALAKTPSDPALTVQLASVYHAEGKPEKSIPLVEALHKTIPENLDVTHLLAGLYLDMQDYALAEPLLAALAVQRPQDTSPSSTTAPGPSSTSNASPRLSRSSPASSPSPPSSLHRRTSATPPATWPLRAAKTMTRKVLCRRSRSVLQFFHRHRRSCSLPQFHRTSSGT